jgi:predicted Rossmann fold nucleotide-binding protein DprA/Smf involved in DNA uptake
MFSRAGAAIPIMPAPTPLIRDGAILVDSPEDLLAGLGLAQSDPGIAVREGSAFVIRTIIAGSKIPLRVDEIIEATTLPASEVGRSLAVLLMEGVVKENAGRYTV